MSTVELQDPKTQKYTKEKKPGLLKRHPSVGVLLLKMLCQQALMVTKSIEDKFGYINHLWWAKMLDIIVDTIPQ